MTLSGSEKGSLDDSCLSLQRRETECKCDLRFNMVSPFPGLAK